MMSRFSSFVLALLLLVVSGQVMAAGTCTSAAAGALDGTADGVPWAVAGAAGTGCSNLTGAIVAPGAANVLSIGAHAIGAPSAATISVSSVAFTAAGSLTLTAKTLNVGTTLNTTNGVVTVGAGGTLSVTGALTNGGSLSVNGGTLILGNNLNNTGGTLTLGTGTVKILGSSTITVAAIAAINVLDLSTIATGSTITFAGAFNNTVTTLTLPTANPVGGAAKTVIFKVPNANTLQIPVGTISSCAVVGAAGMYVISATGVISVTGTQAAGDNVTCTVPAATAPSTTSAPIFSTKEKAAVFSQEVK